MLISDLVIVIVHIKTPFYIKNIVNIDYIFLLILTIFLIIYKLFLCF